MKNMNLKPQTNKNIQSSKRKTFRYMFCKLLSFFKLKKSSPLATQVSTKVDTITINDFKLIISPPSTMQVSTMTINDFSDDILSHILSFLSVRDAFRTSVLSKRWVLLCHSLSVLHMHDRRMHAWSWTDFNQAVNAVILSPRAKRHGESINLKSFHLMCRYPHYETGSYDFNQWIEVAKRRGVEDLDLHFSDIPLWSTIFCCKTLVVLKLTRIVVVTMFGYSVDLPLLKTLDLCYIHFQDMKDFLKILSGCPKLENLNTIQINANASVKAGGYFKPLSKLINANIHLFEVPLRAVYNVQSLTVNGMEKSFPDEEINSYYKGFSVFRNLTKLLLYWCQGIHYWGEVVKMLQNCPKLQTLEISKGRNSTTIENWKYSYHVPECVSSHLTTCKILNYEALEADFRFATYILQNARHLHVMIIRHTIRPNPTEKFKFLEDLSSCPRISPLCRLSFLIS